MKESTRRQKDINRLLVRYCADLFQQTLRNGGNVNDLIYLTDTSQLNFYEYPEDPSVFCKIANCTMEELTELGWVAFDLPKRDFVIWYKKNAVQLCPVDVFKLEFNKPQEGLNRDIPYLFPLVSYYKTDIQFVVVVESPMIATMLNAMSIPVLATNSKTPTLHQVQALARLQLPVIYMGEENKAVHAQGAELLVKRMNKYVDTSVCFIESWESLFKEQCIDDYLGEKIVSGIEFLANRIVTKHNGKTDYERSIEVIETANEIGETSKEAFLRIAERLGVKSYSHFPAAIQLMADLVKAHMPIDKARDTVIERYGVSVFVQDHNRVKLI